MHQTLSSYYYFMKPSLDPRSELNLDLKNIRQEHAKFWKQHPAIVKTELLIQAQLTRESADLPSTLQADFEQFLEITPSLLEELMKMAVIPRNQQGHGWLRSAMVVLSFLIVSFR